MLSEMVRIIGVIHRTFIVPKKKNYPGTYLFAKYFSTLNVNFRLKHDLNQNS